MQCYICIHSSNFLRKISLDKARSLFSTSKNSYYKILCTSRALLDQTVGSTVNSAFRNIKEHERLKHDIKEATADIKSQINTLTTNELFALLLTYIQIFKRCRITGEFYQNLLKEIIAKLNDVDSKCKDIDEKAFIKNGVGHLIPLIKSLHINETYGVHLFGALRYFEGDSEFSSQVWDYITKRVSSSIQKFPLQQLQQITDHLSTITVRKSWKFTGPILLRATLLMMDKVDQTNQSLNIYNILNIFKALSKGNVDVSSEIVTKLFKYIENSLDSPMETPYRWTKLKVHLLQTLLLCNFATPILVEKLIDHIRMFCSSCGSINVKYLQDTNDYVNQYNTNDNIDPRNSLYPKYANFIVPGGLEKPKVESNAKFLYLAGLEKLQEFGKITFCRSIKLIQILISMEYPYMISSFSSSTLSFLEQVNKFQLKSFPEPNKMIEEFESALKLKFTIKVIGPFETYYIDKSNDLICLEPVIQRQLTKGKHCKMLDIKLKYLNSMGWSPKLVYESEWKKLSVSEKKIFAQNLWGLFKPQ
ncbi:hypothetical protein BMR1_02g02606 [Babesia microti strain RI]|uniref:RAP domain-containing protein n=1 Tax=Babesia microti (strain RI) TaxID=1133968 RepID=A0A1R4AAK1_BABMR|nr:hypothetical protein BMR1_02g02606 [Babesia microti strain RI]SJK86015.1 hypothetical protein BMR1_02g02606 [Babesia microti strain RI]|eukprot:XP_021338214.1 hypothetical protein BMR1_02g02606 [Babesia microti strain RI]